MLGPSLSMKKNESTPPPGVCISCMCNYIIGIRTASSLVRLRPCAYCSQLAYAINTKISYTGPFVNLIVFDLY